MLGTGSPAFPRDLRTESSGRREGHTAEDAAAPRGGGCGGLCVDTLSSSQAGLYQPAQSLELRRCDESYVSRGSRGPWVGGKGTGVSQQRVAWGSRSPQQSSGHRPQRGSNWGCRQARQEPGHETWGTEQAVQGRERGRAAHLGLGCPWGPQRGHKPTHRTEGRKSSSVQDRKGLLIHIYCLS